MKWIIKKRYRKVFLFFVLSCIISASIVFVFKSKKTLEEKQVLRIALPFDIRSLDIAFSHDDTSIHVMNMVFEGLVRRDVNDMPRPAVAETIEVSENKKHYIFHLRDCKWSDGRDVTAYDFEFSWKRSLDPSSKYLTHLPHYFHPIKNAKSCLLGEVSIDEVAIHAIDEKTLSVELEYPAPYFLDIVALPWFFPLPKHVLEKEVNWGNNENVVCNGAFKLKHWKKGYSIDVEKNLNYWDKEKVYLDGINISIIGDARTTLMMYEKGSLDWVGSPFVTISYDTSSKILDREEDDILMHWLFVNTEKFPLNNKKLRKSLAYAINRKEIVESIFHNLGVPSSTPIAPPMRLSIDPCFKDNDILSAQTLFQEALQEMGLSKEELPTIELSYIGDLEIQHRIAQAIQSQWREVLGMKKVSLKRSEWAVHFNATVQGDYDLGFSMWNVSVLDPSFILEVFRNKADPLNKSNWENKRYKKLLDTACFTDNEHQRAQHLIEAESILMEEMAVIPLCCLKKRFAKKNKLKGEMISSLEFIDFKSAYFEKRLEEVSRMPPLEDERQVPPYIEKEDKNLLNY